MDFSVIIPSRDRIEQLSHALDSVLMQTHPRVEVIVVNDSTNRIAVDDYARLVDAAGGNVRLLNLTPLPAGHGPGYAINRGADLAQGTFLCFLDDDDQWTDPEHLARAWQHLTVKPADLYLANQTAWHDDTLVSDRLWLNELAGLIGPGLDHDRESAQRVDADTLVRACEARFAHLNTLIMRRTLFESLQGLDEGIRYECEWDLYLRAIENADGILYTPAITARHQVPVATDNRNASTCLSSLRNLLFRSEVLDKAAMFSSNDSIVRMAQRHKAYTLKRIAVQLYESGDYRRALFYARQARVRHLDTKWRLFTLLTAARAIQARPQGRER